MIDINSRPPRKTPSGTSPKVGQQKVAFGGQGALELECIAEHHVGNPGRALAESGEDVIQGDKKFARPVISFEHLVMIG